VKKSSLRSATCVHNTPASGISGRASSAVVLGVLMPLGGGGGTPQASDVCSVAEFQAHRLWPGFVLPGGRLFPSLPKAPATGRGGCLGCIWRSFAASCQLLGLQAPRSLAPLSYTTPPPHSIPPADPPSPEHRRLKAKGGIYREAIELYIFK
jgi:hypothetical protein